MMLRFGVMVALLASGCGDNGKAVGAACASDGDCASAHCGPLVVGGGGAKSCLCKDDSDCTAGEACRHGLDTASLCYPTDAGSD